MKEKMMHGVTQIGPFEGDRVQVETLGTVVDFEERADVRGAFVELDGNDHQVWVPLRFLMAAGG